MYKQDTIIIGGGAAGLLCAGFAAERGKHVTVVDKNDRMARKVLITGKGRCNVTNNCTPEEFIRNVRTNPKFLFAAINAFPPSEAIALFERLGVPLKTERGRRVFPVSDKAADIAKAMEQFAKKYGTKLLQKERVSAVLTDNGAICGVKLESGESLEAKAVVIATGGLSYPATGSNGDGYRLAKMLGHTVVSQRPSLVPIATRESWCAQAMGLSLKNVTLTLINKKAKSIFSELGEMLFTHFGVSGPLVLSASSYMKDSPDSYRLEIDLKPALSSEQLDARVLRDFEEFKNRDFINALDKLLPRALIPIVAQLSAIIPETKVHSITREQRTELVRLIKHIPLTPKAFRSIEEAVITSGGVSVKEIDPKTMQSKLVKGLFFAGEVIDVDAFTGGYNLQIAYSTAFLAGNNL